MNTTNTVSPELAEIIAKGHYVPTKRDCEEAGMVAMSDTHFLWAIPAPADAPVIELSDDCVSFDRFGRDPIMEDVNGESRELVFADRYACMAFLRNHIVTAAEPIKMWEDAPPQYIPNQDDCRQARMYETEEATLGLQFKWRYPNSIKFIDYSIIFPKDGGNPYLVHNEPTALLSYSAPDKVRDVAFANKEDCDSFLRYYPFVVAANEGGDE